MDTVIAFFKNEDGDNPTEIYRIRVRPNGVMRANNELGQKFADSWIKSRQSPQEFVRKFSNWSNGYTVSKTVND
jgi:hypothetical protein